MREEDAPADAGLVVVFCQHDPDRYPGAFDKLRRILAPLRPCLYVRVDNWREGRVSRRVAADLVEVEGDNSLHEFSAWTRGLEVCRESVEAPGACLLVTDAFEAYGDDYEDLIDPATLSFLLSENAAAGLVNRPGRRHPEMVLLGRTLEFWLRTSFLLLPRAVVGSLGTLVTVADIDRFCPREYAGRAFRDDAPLNAHYRAYLETWLTRHWHSAFELSGATWDRFREKVRSILNEHMLTGRLEGVGAVIYDLRFLRQRRREAPDVSASDDPVVVELRGDPLGQFAYYRRALGEDRGLFRRRRNR